MAENKSSNPFFRDSVLDNAQKERSAEVMTVQGATNKSLILGALILVGAGIGMSFPSIPMMIGAAIIALVLVIASSFRPQWSPWTAPAYAVCEGIFVGTVSLIYASLYNGIVFQAVTLTTAVFFLMLFLYKSGVIKVTDKLRSGIVMATGALAIFYLVTFLLSLVGINMPYIHQGGWIGIGFSLFAVGLASLNLLLDFDNFEDGERAGVPAYYEWYFALGLVVTLVWLYLEILRLLAKLSSRD